jgi:hypothetical protein
MSIENSLRFLQEQYGLSYGFQTFKKDVTENFYGPMNTYSFYNETGCFTIYHAVQRNEWEYYLSKKYSQNQAELLSQNISQIVFTAIGKKRKSLKNLFRSENTIIADIIKEQISINGEFYGIKVIR